ncbi:MBL fold metallo-hydrolase [Candidatus Sumerlaeota bacterium]|nr:MBL fold metallo-hydrolase [Candidatus Sumerlaeota bacterium]
MFVQQFFVKGLAHSSYLLGGNETCAIIDPQRDVEIYLDAAKAMNMKITHILETHLHADFISGHIDLAKKNGAVIYAPKSGKCKFPHKAVSEGNTFKIENMEIKVLDTPGHTPEHISYVVTDTARGQDPVGVFCGDTLFVGDVGRPDLFPGIAQKLAEKLYHSLHDKLLKLPPFCEVYPAHGAGSLCGRAMGAKRASTIGYEKKYNAALQIRNIKKFIASLTTNMPPAPDHFSRCSAINRDGPALAYKMPPVAPLSPDQFEKKSKKAGTIILDIRSYEAFGGQHIQGAWHIDFGGNFATFAGWVLPPGRDILLVTANPAQASEAAVWLRRVGLDRVIGYLEGGMFAWMKDGKPASHVCQISAVELNDIIRKGDKMTLIDARAPREYEAYHIKGAINIPAPDLRTRFKEIGKGASIAVVCSTGHRSSLGASILKQNGFEDVCNVAGGMTGFNAAGFAPVCPVCVIPHGPAFLGK